MWSHDESNINFLRENRTGHHNRELKYVCTAPSQKYSRKQDGGRQRV